MHDHRARSGDIQRVLAWELDKRVATVSLVVGQTSVFGSEQVASAVEVPMSRDALSTVVELNPDQWTRPRRVSHQVVDVLIVDQGDASPGLGGVGALDFVPHANGEDLRSTVDER